MKIKELGLNQNGFYIETLGNVHFRHGFDGEKGLKLKQDLFQAFIDVFREQLPEMANEVSKQYDKKEAEECLSYIAMWLHSGDVETARYQKLRADLNAACKGYEASLEDEKQPKVKCCIGGIDKDFCAKSAKKGPSIAQIEKNRKTELELATMAAHAQMADEFFQEMLRLKIPIPVKLEGVDFENCFISEYTESGFIAVNRNGDVREVKKGGFGYSFSPSPKLNNFLLRRVSGVCAERFISKEKAIQSYRHFVDFRVSDELEKFLIDNFVCEKSNTNN